MERSERHVRAPLAFIPPSIIPYWHALASTLHRIDFESFQAINANAATPRSRTAHRTHRLGIPGEISTAPMATLPLLLIPAFLVPLFLVLHTAALMQSRQIIRSRA
jgi:hypothetical protein